MSETRLIDMIMEEIRDKNILGEIEHLLLTKESLEELRNDYKEEFAVEFFESKREPSVKDLEEYFSTLIIVGAVKDGKKYELLTKI